MEVDPSARTEAGAAAGAASDLGPGSSVGKYRLDRLLGTGGMGVVWAAYDPDLERPVAIKLLRSIDSVATLRTRLLREARAMARLKHPNVLTVYEVGTDRNRDYIAMELIDGVDLDRWLAGKPPRPEIIAALLAAGRGLAAAHRAGLIHRDLKPHNILRGHDGGVYVTDFGLARGQIEDGVDVVQAPLPRGAAIAVAATTQPRALDSVLDSPLTQTGMLIGTPAYMAPEQFAGRAPDPRSDQFAFCVTAWEALTGTRPFAGKTLDELRAAASAGVHDNGGLPPRLASVLVRGLAPDPADRWPDMHTLLAEIERVLAPPPRSRRPMYVTIAVSAVVVSAIAGGVDLMSSPGAASGDDDGRGEAEDDDRPSEARARRMGSWRCPPPDEAFGAAWSSERRKAVAGRHRRETMLIPVTAMLEEVRTSWFQQYKVACALSDSELRREQLECLFRVRDQMEETTREFASGELSLAAAVPLNIAVDRCKRD